MPIRLGRIETKMDGFARAELTADDIIARLMAEMEGVLDLIRLPRNRPPPVETSAEPSPPDLLSPDVTEP